MEDNVFVKMRRSFDLRELGYPSNVLSLLRLALVAPIVRCLLRSDHRTALVIVMISMATDVIDGPLARRRGEESELGKVIDPLADKLTLDTIAVALSLKRGFPWWITNLLLVRDAAIVTGATLIFRKTTHVAPAQYSGKITTALLTAALLLHMLDVQPWGRRIITATLVPLAVSWVQYGVQLWCGLAGRDNRAQQKKL
jgi:CDP-diacylglycerol--glycerol-3-phosphate 3-phosphatidyltransferase